MGGGVGRIISVFSRSDCLDLFLWVGVARGFIKGRAPGKLTGCEQDLVINLPGCFRLLLLLSFIRKTKNAWL